MSWVLLTASFPEVGVRRALVFRRRGRDQRSADENITPHHIPEERLTRIIDRIVCKIDKIDLVIVILSDLGEHGHQDSRCTIDMICRLVILVHSEGSQDHRPESSCAMKDPLDVGLKIGSVYFVIRNHVNNEIQARVALAIVRAHRFR
ncbi:hypothetical protein CY34DRAFT_802289 [Suillus luteus UH-Slu-Lm8-n1]|uniref:Uncharacterized protein n=1 Tax=Suillus luteus UH-Slu-Lm8-n1 TaxID=930992 RepID=A0A0D0B4H5_9AGAM|nr:hypothetical protein CY34DRAFT_802289 [Suillus luteus UH-Slu-Lm8-n1]